MSITSINPATGETVRDYPEMSEAQVGEAITRAHEAFLGWRRSGFGERARAMRRAAAILRERKQEWARLMATEMGKPVREGAAEAEKCAWVCEHYAEHAESFLAPQPVATDASTSYVTFNPLGVVLAVMPWNFPFWQVFRFAAPGLMAGNAGVLKHASNVPGCALAIESIFREAGFPEHLFRTLMIGSAGVGAVIDNPLVVAATLTGSDAAGRAVASRAGSLLKKTVLELGGSDPYLILDDADLESAARVCARARLINSGQSCIAAKRFVVVASQRGRFEELLVAEMQAAKVGDPLAEDTQVGPQARADLRDDLHRQVTESVAAGAHVLLGGSVPPGRGAFYPPSVLTEVAKGMPAYDEEVFGPVAAVIGVADEAEAIAVANDTSFGLGAAVFTRDTARGERIAAEELAAGACFVNGLVKSDPRLPFGGVKLSGYGRELSEYGIREFVNIKTVWIA
jgi:succinate-semialdehyde dehydrogenase / glutarate-semialdehyde dehydrogenase